MKILITGGAGFIGSNLCEHFVGKGHDVTCLDNLSTGFLHNIEPLKAVNSRCRNNIITSICIVEITYIKIRIR